MKTDAKVKLRLRCFLVVPYGSVVCLGEISIHYTPGSRTTAVVETTAVLQYIHRISHCAGDALWIEGVGVRVVANHGLQ